MPRKCPNCRKRFREDKTVCPSCKKTHPAATEARQTTVTRRAGRARASDWSSAPAKHLRRMQLVNYVIAGPLFALAGLSAGIALFGVAGELALARLDAGTIPAALPDAVAFVTETATVSDAAGPFVTLAAATVVLAVAASLFVALGFGIKHGYQLPWMANILVYVGSPLLVGGLTDLFLVGTVLVVVLPTTWLPIVGRGAVNFEPSLWVEPRELLPALLGEFRRLITYPL